MKIKYSLIFLLLFACQFASAQSQDSTALYRHHIGINTHVILDRLADPASRMPLQLMYKYQFSRNGAIRFGAEGMYAKSDSTQSYTNRRDEITDFLFGGSIGYEWQRPLSKLFTLYYGTDGFYQQKVRNIEMWDEFSEPDPYGVIEKHSKDLLTTTSFGIRPFIGFRINIGTRFYLSTETAFHLSKVKSSQDLVLSLKTYSPEYDSFGNPKTYIDYTTNKLVFSYIPITFVNLNWTF